MYRPGKYDYEMGYTLAEFSKALLGDFTQKSAKFTCTQMNKNSWQVVSNDGVFSVMITAQQAAPRTVALLQLPVLKVKFTLQANKDSKLEQQFFARFSKYFHKGGG